MYSPGRTATQCECDQSAHSKETCAARVVLSPRCWGVATSSNNSRATRSGRPLVAAINTQQRRWPGAMRAGAAWIGVKRGPAYGLTPRMHKEMARCMCNHSPRAWPSVCLFVCLFVWLRGLCALSVHPMPAVRPRSTRRRRRSRRRPARRRSAPRGARGTRPSAHDHAVQTCEYLEYPR